MKKVDNAFPSAREKRRVKNLALTHDGARFCEVKREMSQQERKVTKTKSTEEDATH